MRLRSPAELERYIETSKACRRAVECHDILPVTETDLRAIFHALWSVCEDYPNASRHATELLTSMTDRDLIKCVWVVQFERRLTTEGFLDLSSLDENKLRELFAGRRKDYTEDIN